MLEGRPIWATQSILCADNVDGDLLAMPITHSSRVAALAVAISGASGVAGLLESKTGCLSIVLVVLLTHFFGRNLGRLAAGFASLGLSRGVLLGPHHPALESGSMIRSAVAI